MPYPWSDMPKPLVRTLASCDPSRAVEIGVKLCATRGIDMNLAYNGIDRSYPVFLTMSGLCRWMHSKRRLVDVSSKAFELLDAWEPRFMALPLLRSDPWKNGLLLRFEDEPLQPMMYVEPMEGGDPGIRYVVWMRHEDGSWGTVVPDGLRLSQVADSEIDSYTHLLHLMGKKSPLAVWEDSEVRLDLGKLRRVAVNALAAFNEDPQVLVMGSRKAPRRNRDKAGPVRKVSRLTLSYDAACLVTRRWIILPTEEQQEKIDHRQHKSPCLHTVDPHYWRVWVNTPKVGEKVLETREKTRVKGSKTVTYIQYRVKRLRGKDGAYSRGKGEPTPTSTRLVVGPEDINVEV